MQASPDRENALDIMLALVGPRLRDLRGRRELKLSDVAAATGISVSTLSRLESGLRRPTLDLLVPLAQLYQVPLDDVVGTPPTGDPRIHPQPIRRHGRIYLPLTGTTAPVQAFKVVIPARRAGQRPRLATHEGYEWLYVLSGRIDLVIDDQITSLDEGEAAEFDTRRRHAIRNGGSHPAEILTLFSHHGEHIHVR